MTIGFSSIGEKKGALRITLRAELSAGVSLGGNRGEIMPGETKEVPHGIAVGLIATGRATLAPEVETPDPAVGHPEDEQPAPETPATPVPQTPDPKPSVAAPPPRRRR